MAASLRVRCHLCSKSTKSNQFSSNQLQKPKSRRKCKVCIEKQKKKTNVAITAAANKGDHYRIIPDEVLGNLPFGTSFGKWTNPGLDAETMAMWEDSCHPERRIQGCTGKETLDRLGITPSFVRGLEVGDWDGVTMRMRDVRQRVSVHNDPPLHKGDYVEVITGNDVKWELVGERGILVEYFKEDHKWGIDFQNDQPRLIKAGNLKRVENVGVEVNYNGPRKKS